MKTKICTRCKKEKPLGEFCKGKTRNCQYFKQCNGCRAKRKQWRENNPEKVKSMKRREYVKHRDAYIKKSQHWAKDNPERRKEISDGWVKKNPERQKLHQKKYANKPEIKMRVNKWHRKRIKELSDSYIKGLICHNSMLHHQIIPEWMVSVHRTRLKIKRYSRGL